MKHPRGVPEEIRLLAARRAADLFRVDVLGEHLWRGDDAAGVAPLTGHRLGGCRAAAVERRYRYG